MNYKIVIKVGDFPPRNIFDRFNDLSPNNMKINFIDVNGVYVSTDGDFIYLGSIEVSEGMAPYNVIGFDRYNRIIDYTFSCRKISRHETSHGHKMYLLEEE